MKKCCKTCKWWNKIDNFGECECPKIGHENGSIHKINKNKYLAICISSSNHTDWGSYSSLFTHYNFYCNCYKQRN